MKSTGSHLCMRGDVLRSGHLPKASLRPRTPTASVAMAQDPAVPATGQATVTADVNGDGKMDLATTTGKNGGITIRLGKGDGTFMPAVTYQPRYYYNAIVAGDFNGDGKVDLAVSFPFLVWWLRRVPELSAPRVPRKRRWHLYPVGFQTQEKFLRPAACGWRLQRRRQAGSDRYQHRLLRRQLDAGDCPRQRRRHLSEGGNSEPIPTT